jgi:hypothetical protein
MNNNMGFMKCCVNKGKGHGDRHDEFEDFIAPGNDKMNKSSQDVAYQEEHPRNKKNAPQDGTNLGYPLQQVRKDIHVFL